jgi:ComF family protein
MLQGLLDLVFPAQCLLCGRAGQPFCSVCETGFLHETLAPCPRCGLALGPYAQCSACARERFGFDAVISLGRYEGVRREAILRLKSGWNESLAELLGQTWAARVPCPAEMDAVVPVPLHWSRRWQRGYNQAEALARGLASGWGLPMHSRWLWRVRPTSDQKGLGRDQRRENLRAAFCVACGVSLQGLRVVLVDDVMTTGATCSESALALKKAGALRVIAAVLARAND